MRCLTEDFILQYGHRLFSHLEAPMASGVAILVHQKYADKIKKTIYLSDRVMAIDVRVGIKDFRIISCYLPHAGYERDYFESVMTQISQLVSE